MYRLRFFKVILTLSLFLIVIDAFARDKHIQGEFTYYGLPGETIIEMRQKALVGAKTDALAREFGTIVSEDMVRNEYFSGKHESEMFILSSQSMVRGEWIADDGEPVFRSRLDDDGTYIVECKVKGFGRRLSNKAPKIEAEVLNLPDKKGVCRRFESGDDIYVYLRSPETDVYAMVCLLCEDGIVQKFFPYVDTDFKKSVLKKGVDYILLDQKNPIPSFGNTDGFHIEADQTDINRLYVIYSPSYFSPGPWIHSSPDYMTQKAFNEWLIGQRRIDDEMGWKVIDIMISPKEKD